MDFKLWLENEPVVDYNDQLPDRLIAYHGGASFDAFDLNNLGSGEGRKMNSALGPGIYFSDCEWVAALYTKHADWRGPNQQAIYQVELDAKNIYDRRNGTQHLNQIINDLWDQHKHLHKGPFRPIPGYEGLFRLLGKQAIPLLVNAGVDGVFTRLPSGCKEIAVINPKIIRIIQKKMAA